MTKLVPIGEVAAQVRGVSYAKQDATTAPGDGLIAILRAGNIADAGLSFEDLVYVPKRCVSDDQMLRKGDVLVATSSGSVDVVGKAAQARSSAGVSFGAFCKVLRPNARIEPRYFAHYFRTTEYRRTISKLAAGANINNLRNEHLNNLLIPLPPLAEQRRIADLLDKADAIRGKRKAAIALTEELLRSAFLEMFGDPVTNPKGWPVKTLGELGDITTGNTPSRAVPDYFGDEIEWIKSDNINTPSHFLTRATEGLSGEGRAVGRTAPAGSTLMTCIAGSPACIGNVALADREVAFNQQINAVTPLKGVDSRFLYVLLLVGKRLIQAASTHSMKGMVSKGKLEEVEVPAPPPGFQLRFGETFDRVVALSRRQDVAAREAQRLFDNTVQRAFSGAREASL